jgi:hypothetical protein
LEDECVALGWCVADLTLLSMQLVPGPFISERLDMASCSRHGCHSRARSNTGLFHHAAVRIAKNVALKYVNVYKVSSTRLLSH